MKKLFLSIIIALIFSRSSLADCVWKWDCSSGFCQHIPICENALDIVPPETSSVPPIPPASIKPINPPIIPPIIPPIGTSQCDEKYVCNDEGYCEWQQVCE